MPIELVTSNYLILCCLLLLPSIFFQLISSSHQVAKVLELQLQHQSFQCIFKTDFLWDGLVGSPCSPRDSQESSPTPQFRSINFQHSVFFIVQHSHPHITTGKTIALSIRTFVSKVISMLLSMLSRFIISLPFLPRSKRLLSHGCRYHLQWFWSPKK